MRSAYEAVRPDSANVQEFDWSSIWKIKIGILVLLCCAGCYGLVEIKKLFDANFFEHESIIEECRRIEDSLRDLLNLNTMILKSSENNSSGEPQWSRPATGWVKANTDGAVDLKSEMTACDGVIRDDNDTCMGFSRSLGRCLVLMTEIWAIHDILKHM
ncbi:hypothetical protein V6N12_027927 [Hibiscus sabdariffa]|uniref:Uncharacterized protein n=1 Tax=Hibiscus sabdariffa TaxID=183260 RepID=A0ABR2F4D8_9ROSI